MSDRREVHASRSAAQLDSVGRAYRAASSRKRRVAVVAIVVIGAALTVAAVGVFREREEDLQAARLERVGRAFDTALRGELSLPVEALRSIGALHAAIGGELDHTRFERFVAGALSRHPGLYALQWVPAVPGAERAAFEASARAEGLADYSILEEAGPARLRPAGERDVYYPILYAVPENAAVGFDLGSERSRLALVEAARAARHAVVSAPFRLVEDPDAVRSIAVYFPVFDADERFEGLAIEVFRVEPMIAAAFADVDRRGTRVTVRDAAVEAPLYEAGTSPLRRERPYRSRIAFGDRAWTLIITPTDAFAPERERSWIAAGGGGAVTLVLALFVFFAMRARELRYRAERAFALGQYVLEAKIGEGGMGAVYRARHALLRRRTAVKLMRHPSEEELVRFEREVRESSRLGHPNTVSIYDYGRTPEGVFYYAMEYIEGFTFGDLVERAGPLPAGRVAHLFAQVADALGEAHDQGVVHRDIKPANLMICQRGGIPDFVKVLDFGLAMRVDELSTEEGRAVMGTPLYIAPEVVTGNAGTASDVYSLGASMYHCLTGTPPFQTRDVSALYTLHLREPVESPSSRLGARQPEALEALVMRTLAKRPEDRPTVRELGAALLEIARDEGWSRTRSAAWWTEEAGAMRRSMPPAPPADGALLTVDLGRRRRSRAGPGSTR